MYGLLTMCANYLAKCSSITSIIYEIKINAHGHRQNYVNVPVPANALGYDCN